MGGIASMGGATIARNACIAPFCRLDVCTTVWKVREGSPVNITPMVKQSEKGGSVSRDPLFLKNLSKDILQDRKTVYYEH